MEFLYTNHELGKLANPLMHYETKRKIFNEKLPIIREEHRLIFIEEEYLSHINLLERSSPEHYERFMNNDEFNKVNDCFVDTDPNLALVSYIKFIAQKYHFYKEIERLNFCEVKWLKDYKRFLDLYEVLSKYNFLESNFHDFKRFWSLNALNYFNCNIYETSVLLYELTVNGYTSEHTVDSMLEKNIVFAKNGKKNYNTNLTKQYYTKNKSKYNDEVPDHFPSATFYEAMLSFGINLKVKPNKK